MLSEIAARRAVCTRLSDENSSFLITMMHKKNIDESHKSKTHSVLLTLDFTPRLHNKFFLHFPASPTFDLQPLTVSVVFRRLVQVDKLALSDCIDNVVENDVKCGNSERLRWRRF
ncbi:uncharacterized protein V6R79_008104 [Siganus canaliculatus]